MWHKLSMLLVIVGALNIGLVTFFHFDLIAMFGTLSSVINVLVGISGIYVFLSTYTTVIKKV
jgi:uncharacterized membrane protein YuzA (DUF378 family)